MISGSEGPTLSICSHKTKVKISYDLSFRELHCAKIIEYVYESFQHFKNAENFKLKISELIIIITYIY